MRNLETLELDIGTGKDIVNCYRRAIALATKFESVDRVKLCWKTDPATQARVPIYSRKFSTVVSLCGPPGLWRLIVWFNSELRLQSEQCGTHWVSRIGDDEGSWLWQQTCGNRSPKQKVSQHLI